MKIRCAILAAPLAAAAVLTIAAPAAALAPCFLKAPVAATSGRLFKIAWNMGQAGAGTVTRDDGTVVATATRQVGSANVFATSVLGAHTYTLAVTSNGESTSCSAQVSFVYTPAPVSGYDIVIVAGQSNAVGQGNGPFTDHNAKAAYDDRIVQVGRLRLSNKKIVPIGYVENGVKWDGLQSWSESERRVREGFTLTFARLYARYKLEPGRKVVIIPAAYGGRAIPVWLNDSPVPVYSDMLSRINTVLALPGAHRIVAFLWHGGSELVAALNNDPAMNPEIFREDLTQFIAKLRTDLGVPQLPFLSGQLTPHWLSENPSQFAVKQQFEQVNAEVMASTPSAAVVSAEGLTSNEQIGLPFGDGHFNAASAVEFGWRYFKAWQAVVKAQAQP
jgi:hypothetical protein